MVTHTRGLPYKCQKGEKAFLYPIFLQIHERSHTVEKPHECKQCGKVFPYKNHCKYTKELTEGRNPRNVGNPFCVKQLFKNTW